MECRCSVQDMVCKSRARLLDSPLLGDLGGIVRSTLGLAQFSHPNFYASPSRWIQRETDV